MKKIRFAILILIVVLFCVSCEGPKTYSVIVIDKITQKPLDSVFVAVKVRVGDKEQVNYGLQGYTDTAGRFKCEEMIGYGLSVRRWDFYMEYYKKGYVPKIEKNHVEGRVELDPEHPEGK